MRRFHAMNGKINIRRFSLLLVEQKQARAEVIHGTHFPRMYPIDATAIGMNTIAAALEYSPFGVKSPNPMVFGEESAQSLNEQIKIR